MSVPSGGFLLVWTLTIQMVLFGSGVDSDGGTKNCLLLSESESERQLLTKIDMLTQKNFTVVNKTETESYTYVFQLCGDAAGIPGAAVVQFDSKQAEKPTVIGRYNSTQAIGGSDWIMLIFGNGDKYGTHCSQETRKAIVMVSCDRKQDVGPLVLEREDRGRLTNCFYLFELDTSVVCPVIESHLSSGSILLIVAVCLLAVYLIGGLLYQRLIVGAKGMEQFPNYAFWVEVCNLSADGCDFVCRSRNRDEYRGNRGAVDKTLEEEPEERDDHLLPM